MDRNTIIPRTYITNGDRLYYILKVNSDGTALVENCETGYVHDMLVDDIFLRWTEVEFHAIRS